jgi:hypothetical protein
MIIIFKASIKNNEENIDIVTHYLLRITGMESLNKFKLS